MTPKQHEAIRRHGEHVLALFPNAQEQDPVKLCRKLRRLETSGSRANLDYCNGDTTTAAWEKAHDTIEGKLRALLGDSPAASAMYINGDPRGYCLKLDDAFMRNVDVPLHRDFGGYGILAPEIGRNGR